MVARVIDVDVTFPSMLLARRAAASAYILYKALNHSLFYTCTCILVGYIGLQVSDNPVPGATYFEVCLILVNKHGSLPSI